MTLQEIKNKANPVLADFYTKMSVIQEKYKAKYGHYFDLQISPNSFVLEGIDSDFEVIPTSLEKHLADLTLDFPTKIPFQIKVSTNTRVDGTHWFVVTAIVKVKGSTYFIRKDSIGATDTNGWKLKD